MNTRRIGRFVGVMMGLLGCAGVAASAAVQPEPGASEADEAAAACVNQAKSSIGKLVVSRRGKSFVGTAFVWSTPRHAVTALHLVADADLIEVSFWLEDGREIYRTATIESCLRKDDLALLKLNEEVPLNVLSSAPEPLAAGKRVHAVGFPLNSGRHRAVELKTELTNPVGTLGGVVPDKAKRELSRAPVLDVNSTQVLNLEGTLLPGHSGAPMLDAACRVVGIGSGGIDGGAVSWSWGIPADRLNVLLESRDTPPRWSAEHDALFSFNIAGKARFTPSTPATTGETPGTDEPDGSPVVQRPPRTIPREADRVIQTSVGEFVHIATRSLAEIRDAEARYGWDNPVTSDLQVLLRDARETLGELGYTGRFEPEKFRFELYLNPQTGATFALPEGAGLGTFTETAPGVYEARIKGAPVRMLLGFTVQPTPMMARQATVGFEAMVASRFITEMDWEFSYPPGPNGQPMSLFRPDGQEHVRKGVELYLVDMFGTPQNVGYAFETLALKGNVMLGSMVLVDYQELFSLAEMDAFGNLVPGEAFFDALLVAEHAALSVLFSQFSR